MTTTFASTCSCGSTRPHTVAHRQTADGTTVTLWCDGAVTGLLGARLPGIPVARPRTAASRTLALRAGWLLLGEVSAYDLDESGDLYAACRHVARRSGLPGDVRARLAHTQRPTLTPSWTILSADRNGRPTERVWRLPRLRWPGLAVWDHVNHGRCGRYEVASVVPGSGGNTYKSTGIHFRTLAALFDHLINQEAHTSALEAAPCPG